MTPPNGQRRGESGNVIVFVLMAVVLIGIVTAAIRSGGGERANIDAEQLAIRAAEVRQQASEYERAVMYLLQNGVSESAIRFGHADAPAEYGLATTAPETQVFARNGGGAAYHEPAPGLQTAPRAWEFYGNTALPQLGSDRPELIAVLPNVTEAFCRIVNRGTPLEQPVPGDPTPAPSAPTDSGTGTGCIDSGASMRFSSSNLFADPPASPNTMDGAEFRSLPVTQGCVTCDGGFHFFHVLMSR